MVILIKEVLSRLQSIATVSRSAVHLQLFRKGNSHVLRNGYKHQLTFARKHFGPTKAKQLPWFITPEKILSDDENGMKGVC